MTANGGLDLSGVESSYKEAGYGGLFYSLVRTHKPHCVVELGTYLGYSGLHMAAALRDNGPMNAELHLVDLWDSYPFRHCSMEVTQRHFARNGLLDVPHVTLRFQNEDASVASDRFQDGTVDLLHIDISNDADKMAEVVPRWDQKLSHSPNALLVIEGGSPARDRVEWMVTHSKPPIRAWLESRWVEERFSWLTLEPFPSITLLRRR